VTLRFFVVWDNEATCVVAAQSKEHAYSMVFNFGDKTLPRPENVVEIVEPHGVPGILWLKRDPS
jgi:hypothetical protein